MGAKKLKNINQTIETSLDYYSFCTNDFELPILDILNERFTRSFRVSLSNYLKLITNINFKMKTMPFKEWTAGEKEKTCMFIYKLDGLSHPMLLKLNNELSYGIIDRLTGGSGKSYNLENKEFTQIELSLLKGISNLALKDLENAWDPVFKIQAKYLRTEIDPKFIGMIPPQEKAKVVNFKIDFENIKGELDLLYPYSALFPLRNELFTSFKTE